MVVLPGSIHLVSPAPGLKFTHRKTADRYLFQFQFQITPLSEEGAVIRLIKPYHNTHFVL